MKRRLTRHPWSTLLIFVIAVVVCAAATVGPTFYAAARTSIVASTLAGSPPSDRDIEVTTQGPIADGLQPFVGQIENVLAGALGGPAGVDRLFTPPVESVLASTSIQGSAVDFAIGWQIGFCRHLTFVAGRCATRSGQIAVSRSEASFFHWRVGQRFSDPGFGRLDISGIYRTPDYSLPYWAAQATAFFPAEDPVSLIKGSASGSSYDALFTPLATIDASTGGQVGTLFLDQFVRPSGVTAGDIGHLAAAAQDVISNNGLGNAGDVPITDLGGTVDRIRQSWSTLAVPVVLVTTELVLFLWLMLFFVVLGFVENLGSDIALAKLRGLSPIRTVLLGVGEPMLLLAAAFPAGLLAGVGLTHALSSSSLPGGTSVPITGLAIGTAALAIAGGAVAVLLASWRTLRRDVVDQWRTGSPQSAQRPWTLDVAVLVAVAAGIAELRISGPTTSATRGALSLTVPALCGIGVGVVGSRLLSPACRALYRRTREGGGLPGFLAVRQLARRRGGSWLTMSLCAGFSLVLFGVAIFTVGDHNRTQAADLGVGASTVLTVAPRPGTDLGTLVDSADPTGREAAAVEESAAGGSLLLAVQPARFARVAAWPLGTRRATIDRLMTGLNPPAEPPVTIDGDAIRVRGDVGAISAPGAELNADLVVPGLGIETLSLDKLTRSGPFVSTPAAVNGCPCRLQDLSIVPQSGSGSAGVIELNDIQVLGLGSWRSVPTGLGRSGAWTITRTETHLEHISQNSIGLQWRFTLAQRQAAVLAVADRPDPLPAIAGPLHTSRRFTAPGIDGSPVEVARIGHIAAVPGAPADGVIVDLRYAELAAVHGVPLTSDQVWVAPGAAPRIERRLRAEGVPVVATANAARQATLFDQEGPGLASGLFLAYAGVAAVLAGLLAIQMLVTGVTHRRRELVALTVVGASRKALLRSLVLEQATVVLFGLLLGLVAGLVAAWLTLREVPEFVQAPAAVPLSYHPPVLLLLLVLTSTAVILTGLLWVSSAVLVRSMNTEQSGKAAP